MIVLCEMGRPDEHMATQARDSTKESVISNFFWASKDSFEAME